MYYVQAMLLLLWPLLLQLSVALASPIHNTQLTPDGGPDLRQEDTTANDEDFDYQILDKLINEKYLELFSYVSNNTMNELMANDSPKKINNDDQLTETSGELSSEPQADKASSYFDRDETIFTPKYFNGEMRVNLMNEWFFEDKNAVPGNIRYITDLSFIHNSRSDAKNNSIIVVSQRPSSLYWQNIKTHLPNASGKEKRSLQHTQNFDYEHLENKDDFGNKNSFGSYPAEAVLEVNGQDAPCVEDDVYSDLDYKVKNLELEPVLDDSDKLLYKPISSSILKFGPSANDYNDFGNNKVESFLDSREEEHEVEAASVNELMNHRQSLWREDLGKRRYIMKPSTII